MFKKEMNERIIHHLKDYFELKGYKLKKTSDEILFRKILNNGFQEIGISSTNYYDTHYLSFAYGKRVNEIETVMEALEKEFEPNFFYLQKDSLSFAFSRKRVLNEKNENKIQEEKDVDAAVLTIKDFTEKYAFNLFDLLNDLQKVDLEINGEGDKFWLEDDEDQKAFGLFRFDVRRIVIAKLAKSPEDYKKFTEKLMAIEEVRIEEIRQSDEKYRDLQNWFVPKVLAHLEEIVK